MALEERQGVLTYGSKLDAVAMPNLLDVQLKSYEHFLQQNAEPDKRENQGLQQIFNDIFPVTDIKKNHTMEFVSYSLGKPRYTIDECRERTHT